MRTISIILPFFKYKHYFKECLQNLAQSTFKDFELIVVLDHPTEDIDDLLEQYNSVFDMKVYAFKKLKVPIFTFWIVTIMFWKILYKI